MKAEENGRDPFCKETEERTMEFFSFSAKVFRWCRILMIPAAAIMLMGGSWIFWGFPIPVLSLPCFLLGIVYIGMGRTAPE